MYRALVLCYKDAQCEEDFVRILYDHEKIIKPQLEARRLYLNPPPKKLSQAQVEKEQRKQYQLDMCDRIRECSLLIMDALLALVEIFQNLLSHGESAQYFKEVMLNLPADREH